VKEKHAGVLLRGHDELCKANTEKQTQDQSPGDTSKWVRVPGSAAIALSRFACRLEKSSTSISSEIGSPVFPAVILSRILVK